jgi:uncharacterized membrane protein YeaQ/YmgE (transglycosylase-associated protein family)
MERLGAPIGVEATIARYQRALQRTPSMARPSQCHRAGENAMEILWMLIIGLIVGALAKLIMPGKDPGGVIVTMLIGVAGALLAGLIGRSLGWYQARESAGFIASIIGAVALLAVYRAVIGRRGSAVGPGRPVLR